MNSRKITRLVILLVFCIGLLSSISLSIGNAAAHSQYAWGIEKFYPPDKDPIFQPMVGWNSFLWVLPPDKYPEIQPMVGWNSYSWVLPPDQYPTMHTSVGWNS